ncbi:MAG: hypothetical protein ACPGF7_09065 [Pontibacterium sp.]
MGKNLRFFVVVILVSYLSACQTLPARTNPLNFQRGIVVRESGELFLRPCFSTEKYRIYDDTGDLRDWFAKAPQVVQQVYVELMARPAEAKQDSLHIQKVLMAGFQPRACEFELNGNRFRAAGVEPFWIADIRREGIRVQGYKGLNRLLFPVADPGQQGNDRVWRSQLTAQKVYRLKLTLTEKPCYDAYGMRYRYQADLLLNKESFKGCARDGNLGQRTLPGVYLPQNPQQLMRLQLQPDGGALLSEGVQEQGNTIVSHTKGRWTLAEPGQVRLVLDGENKTRRVWLFSRVRDGSLALMRRGQANHRTGLTLHREYQN